MTVSSKNRMSTDKAVSICLAILIFANICLWFSLRGHQVVWLNVPPAPDHSFAAAYGIGDTSFAYRVNGIMLQNFGDTGGRVTHLDDYDYEALGRWFHLQHHLDERSDFTPYLAAYYFGGVRDASKLGPVASYLHEVGNVETSNKWRWLAQAVYLLRFRMKDYDKALEYASDLAALDIKGAPAWVKQMPAFIKGQVGDKEAAYALMLQILKTSSKEMHPSEVHSMRVYMCERLQDKEQAQKNPLCDGL